MTQAHFLKHAPCPRCGSKDNLALYSDGGGFCFGCGYVISKKVSGYVNQENHVSQLRPSVHWLVGDEAPEFSSRVGMWLAQYPGCSIEELISRRVTTVKGNPDSILFRWDTEQGLPCLQQVRYFPSHPKRKYITYGKPAEVLPIYQAFNRRAGESNTGRNGHSMEPEKAGKQSPRKLVIVEDALSAIKMARSVDSMPCLGSDLPLAKITALSRLYEAVVVWLDGNMFHKAQKIASRFQMLGLEASAVYTELDPKCYTHEEMLDKVGKV